MDTGRTRVTILGSGTCVPSLTRSACAVLVEAGTARILLDAGPGTMHRLLEAGLNVSDITHLLISHFHPDHTGELVTFLFANKYPNARRRAHPLTLVGGKGLKAFFNGLKSVFGDWIVLPPPLFRLLELDIGRPDRLRFQDLTVDSAPVVHRPESLAFRMTGKDGKSVVYSGDTDASDGLAALAEGADLLICESAMPDDLKTAGHLTPSGAGRIAARARVGKLVLTHLYPECDDVDMVGQCKKTFDGPVVLAEDLMVFHL